MSFFVHEQELRCSSCVSESSIYLYQLVDDLEGATGQVALLGFCDDCGTRSSLVFTPDNGKIKISSQEMPGGLPESLADLLPDVVEDLQSRREAGGP